MSPTAKAWRKYTAVSGKVHLCLHPGIELWAKPIRLWRCTKTIAHIQIYAVEKCGLATAH